MYQIILSVISGLAVGLLPVYFQRNMRRLKCAADGIIVLESGDDLDRIAVFCEGIQVPRVTKSYLRVWNAGYGPIRPADVVPSNPLVVSVDPNSRILTARIIKSTEEAVGFDIQRINESGYLLTFPYWGRNEGVAIELQHTSTQIVPKLRGTINGYKRIKSLGKVPAGGLSPTFQYHWPTGSWFVHDGTWYIHCHPFPRGASPGHWHCRSLVWRWRIAVSVQFADSAARLRIPKILR